jgi:DNA mismatch repair protein MutS2
MDETTFHRLEFPAVLEHVAALAESAAARRALLEARPWTDVETIARHWDAVEEILGLLDSGGELPIAGFDDCGGILEKLAVPRSLVEPAEWLALRDFIALGARVRRHLKAAHERMPTCWGRAEIIDPLAELDAEIDRVFDRDGLVRDSASPELRACRKRIQRLEREIDNVFNRLLSRLQNETVLQESYTTLRNGRRVVPVRVGARGRLPGIVHDTSNSGETLFVEPMEAVEPANRLAAEQNREREEVVRVLTELAGRAREDLPVLEENREALLAIDLWHARARLAHRHDLHRPRIERGLTLDLIEAHHPLLFFRDPKGSVPLNMRLEPENRVLVITGPNTGGKTTALKTIGLIALMAQSAIPVPAAVDSRLPLFRQALAEVGDEQSVSAGLSTFSAHIRRISWILEACGDEALVLLDELGKATDPLQAGALGRAILEALIARGALTFVTTHLPTLKDWAHESPAARNASFRLDPRTHRPLYEIHLDTPGISEAFTIARAEGLPDEIVDAAIAHLPKEERELSELLETLHQKEARLEEEVRKAQAARKRTDQQRRELKEVHAELEHARIDKSKRYEMEYKAMLDEARRDIERRIANLPSRQAISQARESIAQDQKAAEARIEAIRKQEEEILRSAALAAAGVETGPYNPSEGDWVVIAGGEQVGRIERINGARGRAKIVVGSLQIDSALEDLRLASPPAGASQGYDSGPRYATRGVVQAAPPELDIHGQHVEEALTAVDKYLDEAVLAHLSDVRIIHGRGTGALRSALHDFLRDHPHAARFRLADPNAGGAAVTLVQLK